MLSSYSRDNPQFHAITKKGVITTLGKGEDSDYSRSENSSDDIDEDLEVDVKMPSKGSLTGGKSKDSELNGDDVRHEVLDIKTKKKAPKATKNLVYIAHIIPSIITGELFNDQQLGIINSIPTTKSLHDTYKVDSSRNANGAIYKATTENADA